MIPNRLPPFDFGLGETADLLRDSIQSFAAAEVAPRAADIDRDNDFPADLWPKLGALGLLGITVEEDYGGAAALPRRSVWPTARTPTYASIRSAATAARNSGASTCRS